MLQFNSNCSSKTTINHLVLCTIHAQKIWRNGVWPHMIIYYYSHLLLSSSHRFEERHSKNWYTKHNSQFKAPLEQVILIEHLCLHNSCLSRNPEINKNCIIRNCARSSTHEKMSKESSRKRQTDYQLHDTSFSLFSANEQ